jgi:hypothetical protein
MNWPWGKGKQNKVTLLDSTTWSKRTKVTNNIDEGRSSETFIQLKSDIKSKIYRNYKVKRLLKFQDLKKKKKTRTERKQRWLLQTYAYKWNILLGNEKMIKLKDTCTMKTTLLK